MRVEDRVEESPGCAFALLRTQALLATQLARGLRRHRLSPAAYSALLLLARHRGPLAPHELGRQLLVSRAAVTGLLDGLERLGLVRRSPHPADRRRLLVELTPAGRRLWREVERVHEERERQVFGCLDPEEQALFRQLLARLQDHLQQLPA